MIPDAWVGVHARAAGSGYNRRFASSPPLIEEYMSMSSLFRNKYAKPLLAVALASALVACNNKPAVDGEETATLIQPVARFELANAEPAAAGGALKTGEQVVTAVCAACHATGAAGAPKIGDAAAWAPRLGLGLEGLTKSAIAGKGAMPPKGGGANLQDIEIARAIVVMANQSGANLKEPEAPAQ